MALSCTVFDIFDFEKYCGLESYSEVTQDRHMVSY